MFNPKGRTQSIFYILRQLFQWVISKIPPFVNIISSCYSFCSFIMMVHIYRLLLSNFELQVGGRLLKFWNNERVFFCAPCILYWLTFFHRYIFDHFIIFYLFFYHFISFYLFVYRHNLCSPHLFLHQTSSRSMWHSLRYWLFQQLLAT